MPAPATRSPARAPEKFDDEYRALQASLEDYLQRQISLLADPGGVSSEPERESWLWRHRADLYFIVTLALIGWLWWQSTASSSTVAERVMDSPVLEEPAMNRTPTDPTASDPTVTAPGSTVDPAVESATVGEPSTTDTPPVETTASTATESGEGN